MPVVGVLLMVVLVGCTGDSGVTPTAIAAIEPSRDMARETELGVVLATTDLAVGENRVAFAVLVDGSAAAPGSVNATFMKEGSEERTVETIPGTYREWPGGRGLYTVQANFDAPGAWLLEVETTINGQDAVGSARFQVDPVSSSPAVGAAAPASRSKTLRDVERIEDLTTDATPDEALYTMSVAEALEADMPLVVAFATPAFCRTATCGPQVDVLKDLRVRYSGRVNFVHVEVFDNPLEMAGDLTKGRVSPVTEEWGLKTEPFTFVIDSSGRVSAKFEAFVSDEELAEAIERNLA